MAPSGRGSPRAVDGRSLRWAAHRTARREELVAAAAAAIAELGPDAHLADLATAAGVSKPVLYRYFGDKDELLVATTRWVADQIVDAMTEVLRNPDLPPRDAVTGAVSAYFRVVDEHRNVFLLAARHRTQRVDGSVTDGKSAAAEVLTKVLRRALAAAGADPSGAEPWAHALVGLGVSTAEWWVGRGTMSREDVERHVSAFIWHAFDGLSREYATPNVTES
jgi:AcrR family transcriptional regulator